MCDGEFMFVESCPGGTVWDDFKKACVWPDMRNYANILSSVQSQEKQGFCSFSFL